MRPGTNASNNRSSFNRFNRPEGMDKDLGLDSTTHDRYLPVIINLESQNMLDEYTAGQLKTLILEDNVEVCRIINGFLARLMDE